MTSDSMTSDSRQCEGCHVRPAGIGFGTTAEQADNVVTDVTALVLPIWRVTFGSTTSPRQTAITFVHLGFWHSLT